MENHFDWLKSQLPLWEKNSLIDSASAQKILDFYEKKQKVEESPFWNYWPEKSPERVPEKVPERVPEHKRKPVKASLILSVIAALFIAGGIISLIAYNWHSISRFIKTIGAFIINFVPAFLMLPVFFSKKEKSIFKKAGFLEFVSALWIVLFGASIEFLSQIYMLPVSWQLLFFLWTISSVLIMLLTKTNSSRILSFILFISFSIAEKSVLFLIPVSSLLYFYASKHLKIKKEYVLIVKYASLFVLIIPFLFLSSSSFWGSGYSLRQEGLFLILNLLTFGFCIYSAVRERRFSHELMILVYPLVVLIFNLVLNYAPLQLESFNAFIPLFIILLIYNLYSAFFLKKVWFYITSAGTFLLLIAGNWKLLYLSLVIYILLYTVLLFYRHLNQKDCDLNVNLIILNSLLSLGYVIMVFHGSKSYIAYSGKGSLVLLQNILLMCMGLSSFGTLALGWKKLFSDKKLCFKLLEFLILLLVLTLYYVLSYVDFFTYALKLSVNIAKFLVATAGLYATFKLTRFKDYSLTGFVAAFLLTFILDAVFGFNFFVIILFFAFGLAVLGLFLQSFPEKGKENAGRIVFIISTLFIIFLSFKVETISAPYYENEVMFYIEFLLTYVYLFFLGVFRPFLKLKSRKERINYAQYLYTFCLFFISLLVVCSFAENKPLLNRLLEVVCILLLMFFALEEIIFQIKEGSTAGVNIYSVYLLFLACVKFFTATNSLIARGIAFILCGIIILVINLLLPKIIKKADKVSEVKDEK